MPDCCGIGRVICSSEASARLTCEDDFATLLGDGFSGTSWLVRLADDRLVVLKVAPVDGPELPRHLTDSLRGEVEALQMIAEHTGVPVPQMHHHDDGQRLVPADWYCREYLPGTSLAEAHELLPEAELAGLRREVGAMVRGLNSIAGDEFGRFQHPTLDSWRDAFTGIVEDALADCRRLGVPLGIDPDELHRVVIEHGDALDAVTEPHFCEWRLDGDDVLVADGRVVGLLGHHDAFWGDPLMEPLFRALVEPAGQLLAGYGRTTPLAPDELERVQLYQLFAAVTEALEEHAVAGWTGLPGPLDAGWRTDLRDALGRLDA